MSDQGSAPAVEELLDELDAIENEAKPKKKYDITEKAQLMADDFNVDLDEVKGTGSNGRITVPDVDKYIKSREAEKAEQEEAKATAKSESSGAGEEKPSDDAPVVKKKSAKRKPKSASTAPLLPTLREGITEVRHMVRTLSSNGGNWDEKVVRADYADDKISEYLQEGWGLIQIQHLGVTAEGIDMLWIMGKPVDGVEFPFDEIYHIVQNVGGVGPDNRGLTGFQADALINSYLAEGWELAYVKAIASSAAGINMMWVLVR
jgi:hypothetical protein